jgi:hypothetical protein
MKLFVLGAIAMAYAVAGLFFLRYWARTRDRLFLVFALAFWLLGATRIVMAAINQFEETATYINWVRFAAFVLILLAILDKNRPRGPRSKDPAADAAGAAF